jgi:hypothetical protein
MYVCVRAVCIYLCVCIMRNHAFGISRTINSIVAATVDEKDIAASITFHEI